MRRLFTKEMEFGRGSLEFLGNCTVAHRACYFVRIYGRDVLLMATPLSSSSGPTFARGEHLAFEYRVSGAAPLSALSTAVLEGFTLRLLKQEKRIAGTLKELPRAPLSGMGIELVESVLSGDNEEFQLRVGPDSWPVTVKVGPPGNHPLPLFRWTFAVVAGNDVSTGGHGNIQHFLLLYCAHRVLETPFSARPESDSNTTPTGREVFAYHAPARRDYDGGGIPELQDGDRLRLSFEVPTRCSHRCVFCVAWTDCGPNDILLTTEELLAAATAILSELSRAGGTVSADVVLVGQDALTHPGFLELVRLFDSHLRVQRITVVTPGTGLAQEGLARELAQAGLHGVILTLLAAQEEVHDKLTGQTGAFADLQQSITNVEAAGLDWELNTVVLRANQAAFPALLEQAAGLGHKVRVYIYTNEPMVPPAQVAECAPDVSEFAALLQEHQELVEANVESLHYAPLCLLPKWAWSLSSHASQSLPNPATPLPDACQGCAALGTRCPSVSASYVALFGIDRLKRIEKLD
jgi:molybdenum cofactor biosynthesis enzyme MoaA